jgi:hypothetical protein
VDHYIYAAGVSLLSADAHVLEWSGFPTHKPAHQPLFAVIAKLPLLTGSLAWLQQLPAALMGVFMLHLFLSRFVFFDFLWPLSP